MIPLAAKKELRARLGADACLDRPEDLLAYEYDASMDRARPDMVVFPRSAEEVVELVKITAKYRVPLVARGAGTGLSGGSIPVAGGVVVGFSRMNRILEIDLENERAVVEPGVVNSDLDEAVREDGYFFAPDPSSQKACTIGGNVAENAAGPHTLAHGVTADHVLGLEAVLADGTLFTTGGKAPDLPGYDLAGLLTGSEGMLALITKIVVRLMRRPEAVETALAIYDSAEDCGETVSRITARGITPVALEMLDGVMLRIVEEATGAGYPLDAAAVLLIELEGLREAVAGQVAEIREICSQCRARQFRLARSETERALLWKGRKNAFGAIGRLSPFFLVQDGMVPRTRIASTLRFIREVSERYGLTISNIFHAGDGNMHPIIPFDRRRPGEPEKAQRAGHEILAHCVELGGSITGEHGVGLEKMALMPKQFSADTLEFMARVKQALDPECRLNPGKVFPGKFGCRALRRPAAVPDGEAG